MIIFALALLAQPHTVTLPLRSRVELFKGSNEWRETRVDFSLDPKKTVLTVSGISKDAVGACAADIRELRKPEPYKGTGIRYQGEYVRKKAGKTAAGASAGAGGKK